MRKSFCVFLRGDAICFGITKPTIMNLDTLFNVTCGIAAIGWIILLFISPFWSRWDKVLVAIIITIPALTYTYLNFINFEHDMLSKFSTLNGVQSLFQNKALVLAAWEHFLAFDLIVAVWIKKNSLKHGISHWLIIPALIMTCLLGPLGFLIYLLIRIIKTKTLLADNTA
jgi:glucan phosphoethanolaminetransferase (alkaline phosphatase superfamily)